MPWVRQSRPSCEPIGNGIEHALDESPELRIGGCPVAAGVRGNSLVEMPTRDREPVMVE